MKRYVDGFVLPIPTKNHAAYARMARISAKVWLEHGALEYHECIADDAVLAKVMMDPKKMPFDGKRMIYGGFKTVVSKSR